jgi:hypothetical protein
MMPRTIDGQHEPGTDTVWMLTKFLREDFRAPQVFPPSISHKDKLVGIVSGRPHEVAHSIGNIFLSPRKRKLLSTKVANERLVISVQLAENSSSIVMMHCLIRFLSNLPLDTLKCSSVVTTAKSCVPLAYFS